MSVVMRAREPLPMRPRSLPQPANAVRDGRTNRTDDDGMAEIQAISSLRGDAEILERAKARLKAQLGQDIFASWFERMKIDEVSKGLVRLSVPTAFLKTWINSHYSDVLLAIFAEEVPGTLKVDIAVRSAIRSQAAAAARELALVASAAAERKGLATGAPAPANQSTVPQAFDTGARERAGAA